MPFYSNKYIRGKRKEAEGTAPGESLHKVLMSVGRLRIIKSQLNLVYKKATTPMTLENKAINQKYIFVISHRNEGADINYK